MLVITQVIHDINQMKAILSTIINALIGVVTDTDDRHALVLALSDVHKFV
jgi:hypothetical protein